MNATFKYLLGPKPETVSDFWQMIWEQRSTIIIMLTKLVEKTRVSTVYASFNGIYIYATMIISCTAYIFQVHMYPSDMKIEILPL